MGALLSLEKGQMEESGDFIFQPGPVKILGSCVLGNPKIELKQKAFEKRTLFWPSQVVSLERKGRYLGKISYR